MTVTPERRDCGPEPSTPSPTEVHTPDAPRFGTFHDKGGPLSPRRSTRISGRSARDRTPSPARPAASSSPQKRARGLEPPVLASPRKRPAPDVVRRASGILSSDSKPMSTSIFGGKDTARSLGADLLSAPRGGALLTPAKTPQQKKERSSVNVDKIARTLFGQDPMSSPQRQAKLNSSGLDSFEVTETSEIEIFTDSKERVPKKDDGEENPFWRPTGKPFVKSDKVSRAKVWVPAEQRSLTVEEASKRTDGQVRVFRGRKIWVQKVQHESESEDMRFPSFKPKRLFGPKQDEKAERSREEDEVEAQKTQAMLEAEEAATDVEDETEVETQAEIDKTEVDDSHQSANIPSVTVTIEPATAKPATAEPAAVETVEIQVVPATPRASKKSKMPETPSASRMAPLSPPETRRVTRSMDKPQDATPAISPTRSSATGGRSPAFAGFKISKPVSTGTPKSAKSSGKRAGEHLAPTEAKRTRV